jgi:hypothetical protein
MGSQCRPFILKLNISRMKRIVIYLMFLPVLTAAQPVKTKQVHTKGKETLLITLMTKYKDDILLYHYDEFGNSQGMLLGNNTLDPGSI